MSVCEQALGLFRSSFGRGHEPCSISVPGRVNLIGEHIDYHDLSVLPMAIDKHIAVAFRACDKRHVRAVSGRRPELAEFSFDRQPEPGQRGEWANYLKAAVLALSKNWRLSRGIEIAIASSLPEAAGLSSSSALMTGVAIALLRANDFLPSIEELMDVLPQGEQFVGTRGGGMDHAAVLASRSGSALLVRFAPLGLSAIPIPNDWSFTIAHTMTIAEKSGALLAEYNKRRLAGLRALKMLGLPSYRAALNEPFTMRDTEGLTTPEMKAFKHVVGEAQRVQEAVAALRASNLGAFGRLLVASHESLRDELRVSTPALDSLVDAALASGAAGARLTGAGFGGCTLIVSDAAQAPSIRERLNAGYFQGRPGFNPEEHLFEVRPSRGALA